MRNFLIGAAVLALALGGVALAQSVTEDFPNPASFPKLFVKGNLTVKGLLILDAGTSNTGTDTNAGLTVNGDAGIAGATSLAGGLATVDGSGNLTAQDAGILGSLAVTGTASVNGFAVPQIKHFSDAGTGGLLDVAVSPSFGAVPDCTCSNSNATTAACDITARSVSHIQAKSGSGTDVLNIICVN